MSNIKNNRLFKRLGAGTYLDMLAKRNEEEEEQNKSSSSKFELQFDDQGVCSEINEIVLTENMNNYYEYKILNLSGTMDKKKIIIPREFYLTGIQIFKDDRTNFSDIVLKVDNGTHTVFHHTLRETNFYHAVTKIKRVNHPIKNSITNGIELTSNVSLTGFTIVLNGFL